MLFHVWKAVDNEVNKASNYKQSSSPVIALDTGAFDM